MYKFFKKISMIVKILDYLQSETTALDLRLTELENLITEQGFENILDSLMSKTTENSIGSLSINDYKLRTNLAKDRMRLREYIFRNNPGTLTYGQGEKIVVPSPRTFGIDGTLSEINDVSGEYKYKVIACASTTGVILEGRHQYDFAKSDTIWSTNLEKDLLQMRLLEFQPLMKLAKILKTMI